MFWRAAHDALKYLPVGISGGAITLGGAFDPVHDAIGDSATVVWQRMSDPTFALSAGAVFLAYLAAIVFTGIMAKRAERPQPLLEAHIGNIIAGGVLSEAPKRFAFLMEIEIRNTGTMASAIPVKSWFMKMNIDGAWQQVTIAAIQAPIKMGSDHGTFMLRQEDMIFEKARAPADVGTILDGFIFAPLNEKEWAAFDVGAAVRISFKDVLGREYSCDTTQGAIRDHKPYLPTRWES